MHRIASKRLWYSTVPCDLTLRLSVWSMCLQITAIAIVVYLLCGATEAAWAKPRLAVVIGNTDYRSVRLPDLPNAGKDAAAVAERLKELGFTVIKAENATAARMQALVQQAQAEQPEEALLFFYAGHALEAGGETFLLPTDSPDPVSVERVTEGALRLGAVVARFADPARPTLVFVDACRTRTGALRGEATGLPGENMFLAFASQPGQDAVDGAGETSPFTRALLETLLLPEADVAASFGHVQAETARLTLGRQIPGSASTLRRSFVFRAAANAVPRGG